MKDYYPRYQIPLLFLCISLCLLLAACGQTFAAGNTDTPPVTPTATTQATVTVAVTPTAASTSTAKPVQTSCPTNGNARAAIMPDISLGSNPAVVTVDSTVGNTGASSSSTLKRYDVATHTSTTIVSITQSSNGRTPISNAQISPDGKWVAFVSVVESRGALQIVRVDGKEQQTLYCFPATAGQWNATIQGISWSPDQQYLAFNQFSMNPQGANLLVVNLSTGNEHVVAQSPVQAGPSTYYPLKWASNTSLYVTKGLIGVGDTRNRRGLFLVQDVTRDASQQSTNVQVVNLPTISGASQDLCKDFDVSPDGGQLLYSDCSPAASIFNSSAPYGKSTIETQSLPGGSPRTVYANATHAILNARFIANDTIMFYMHSDSGKTPASEMQQEGVWTIHTDGTGLTHLNTDNSIVFSIQSYEDNLNLSLDRQQYAFLSNEYDGPLAKIVIGSMQGTVATTLTTGNSSWLALVGWTTF